MNLKRMELIEDVFEINRRVCSGLWDIANVNSTPKGLSPRLIIPRKRSGIIRMSEQEARILYCGILNNLNYYYSVETPTGEVYQQTGMTPVSASSDLSLYTEINGQFEKVMNVEFKAHNPVQELLRKDIEKLIRETIPGNWFHLLKNMNSKTLSVLFEKMKGSFLECKNIIDGVKLSFVFCFCVLDRSWACMKHFCYDPAKDNFQEFIDAFFTLNYFVTSGKIEIETQNNWRILSKLR